MAAFARDADPFELLTGDVRILKKSPKPGFSPWKDRSARVVAVGFQGRVAWFLELVAKHRTDSYELDINAFVNDDVRAGEPCIVITVADDDDDDEMVNEEIVLAAGNLRLWKKVVAASIFASIERTLSIPEEREELIMKCLGHLMRGKNTLQAHAIERVKYLIAMLYAASKRDAENGDAAEPSPLIAALGDQLKRLSASDPEGTGAKELQSAASFDSTGNTTTASTTTDTAFLSGSSAFDSTTGAPAPAFRPPPPPRRTGGDAAAPGASDGAAPAFRPPPPPPRMACGTDVPRMACGALPLGAFSIPEHARDKSAHFATDMLFPTQLLRNLSAADESQVSEEDVKTQPQRDSVAVADTIATLVELGFPGEAAREAAEEAEGDFKTALGQIVAGGLYRGGFHKDGQPAGPLPEEEKIEPAAAPPQQKEALGTGRRSSLEYGMANSSLGPSVMEELSTKVYKKVHNRMASGALPVPNDLLPLLTKDELEDINQQRTGRGERVITRTESEAATPSAARAHAIAEALGQDSL